MSHGTAASFLVAAMALASPAGAHAATGPCATTVSDPKSQAILGGGVSELERIRLKQAAVPAPAAGGDTSRDAIVIKPQSFQFQNRWHVSYAPAVMSPDALAPLKPVFRNFAPALDIDDCPPSPLPTVRNVQAPQYALRTTAAARPGHPDVFGSVALAVSRTSLDSKWRRVARDTLGNRAGPWSGLIAQNRGQKRMAQIASVNAWVNARIDYTEDARQYGPTDHWATAAQSLTRARGDCEDYAIAKMQILKALGVPSDSMYLVIARDLVRQADHAVLAVALDGDLFVLDNETDRIFRSADIRDYRPVLSFSGGRSWTHGYRRTPPVQLAALTP